MLKFDGKSLGVGYFNQLPEGWRLATESDFYRNKQLVIDRPYLMLNNSQQYEAYRTKTSTIYDNINNILLFVKLKRVWVLASSR